MSKIYEALKKAREGNSEVLPASSHNDRVQQHIPAATVPVRDLEVPAKERQPLVPGPSHSGLPGQYLRFDDLLKQCAKPVWYPDPVSILFSDSYSPALGAEQFRTLRSRLYHLRDTAPLKKVMITSAMSGEGKTLVATNLAQAIARERDRKVLLIDGDLRRSQLHLPLGAPVSPGLSEYLRDEAGEADIIQHGQEGNLCFIAGGNNLSNASELLSTGRLQKLLDRIAPLFDWVILDSPPCLPVADAGVMAALVDGVLLVVRASSTPSALTQKARKELQNRNVVGVVLNGVEDQAHGPYYYHGYGYHPAAAS
jgi:protein-tyrosine kinase